MTRIYFGFLFSSTMDYVYICLLRHCIYDCYMLCFLIFFDFELISACTQDFAVVKNCFVQLYIYIHA